MAMNLISLIIPKSETATLDGSDTVRQAIEKMSHHHYTSIPVLGSEGHYLYSISTGDILFYLSEHDMTLKEMENVPLEVIPVFRPVMALSVTATENDIKRALLNQNFIPMVDERGIFIGIVTRRRLAQTLSESIPE